MRLTIKDDGAVCRLFRVFLNGVELHDCVVADEGLGMVTRVKRTRVGHVSFPKRETWDEYGVVEIRPTDVKEASYER